MSQNNGSCDCKDYSLQTANTGLVTISTGNALLTGSGATTVITATGSHNGTIIKSIKIKAAGTGQVTWGMIRLFVSIHSKLFNEKRIKHSQHNDFYELTENILTSSPSSSACLILGNDRNGYISWRTKNGEYLDIYKK